MNGYVIWLLISVVVGAIAAEIAKVRGRDPVKWFFLGMLLNVAILGLIVGVSAKRQNR